MLATGWRNVSANRLSNMTFQTEDLTNLPFDVNAFDAATSQFNLQFLPEIPKAAGEIARARKPL